MIRVVDSIMGSGKTTATIQYMKSNPNQKYLYITPFLEETERIKSACPELDFKLPMSSIGKRQNKQKNLLELVMDGENISMTHALFTTCVPETVKAINDAGYVIFIDEVIDMLVATTFRADDINIMRNEGLLDIVEDGCGGYQRMRVPEGCNYHGEFLKPVLNFASRYDLIEVQSTDELTYCYYWQLPASLFANKGDIYILTYLFDGMPLKACFEMYGIQYEKWGIKRGENGEYLFSPSGQMPEYTRNLSKMIHICDNRKLNAIGDRPTALSYTWITKSLHKDGSLNADRLRKKLYTYFDAYAPKEYGTSQRIWCTFKEGYGKVRGKGYFKRFLVWNTRATNAYRDCRVLAYLVNVYCNPALLQYLKAKDLNVDLDQYALAYMLQWIWRSAIRDGKEIWIYVPSRRMRELLQNWIEDVEAKARCELAA